jgi:acylphosphatase
MRRVHLLVRGDVQGVGFRYTMRLQARTLGTAGWVRNRADGSVDAEVEGSPSQVDEMLAWVAEGPPGSRVDAVDLSEVATTGASGFDVRESA